MSISRAFRVPPACFMVMIALAAPAPAQTAPPPVPDDSKACVECHDREDHGRGIVAQWQGSRHAALGVGCFDCHQAEPKDVDAFDHFGRSIATIASPLDCQKCHDDEVTQFERSRHARAAEFIGSLDNLLGEIVEGAPAAISGCKQCHGSTVTVTAGGKIDPAAWPNTGIGRVNPDGSKGSCAACHARHSFSKAQARQPEPCGKCHLGPDHPQFEIYNESKHGIRFATLQDPQEMNLDSDSWMVGRDYTAAPTCATCHLSATPHQAVTHDAGERLSWTLRPAISVKLDTAEKGRAAMKEVCNQCHAAQSTGNFYIQFDEAVELWNEKFARPAKGLMDHFHQAGKLTATPFDEKLEWTYYELWHHEGRRARHGASMLGPDFTQWHGFYEVAKVFYNEFLPACEELEKGSTAAILGSDFHRWRSGMTDEQKKTILDFYRQRYGQ